MSIKNGRNQMGLSRPTVLALLSLVLTLNASQVTTLCLRPDGRVAIEPVIHDHCPCEAHACGAHTSAALAGVTAYDADARCQPCADLSVPAGSCHGRAVPGHHKVGPGGWAAALPQLLSPVHHAIDLASPDPPPAPVPPGPPLDSMVLKV